MTSLPNIIILISTIILLWQIVLLIKQLVRTKKDAKEAQAKIIESEAKFRLAFDYSPIGIGLLSLENHWLKVNKALCDILGYNEAELLQMDFQSITHPDDLAADLNYIKQLNEGKISYYNLEKRYFKKNKEITWVLLTASLIRNQNGAPLYRIAQIQDINEKKKADHELSYKAYYDTLTGLFNRNQLEHSLEESILSALRHQKHFALFFIDLDYFKKVNDTFGHDIGDELLKIVGERLKHNIRKTDIAARLGGDEFILVLNGIDNVETAAIFAEKTIEILLQPIKIKEHEFIITSSIGISFYPSDGADFNSLIKSADLALYKAKEDGRNNYRFCTPEMNDEIKEKIHFKQALQVALDKHEFHLVYLPKLDVRNHAIAGFEALLRWKNNKYGDVSPNKIIPLAEEMGIITQLSEWIIQSAAENTIVWQQYGTSQQTKIAINVSAKHFTESNFVDGILRILDNIKLSPDYFQLEINENLIMRDPDYSLRIIQQLKKSGIQVIIDNFGTGYSSLNYLYQFSPDYIKIDRQFTHSINTDDHRISFLVAMVKLAKNINIKTLAEGVETKEQSDLLTEIGFDQIQGFYIHPPLLAEEVPLLLESYARKAEILK